MEYELLDWELIHRADTELTDPVTSKSSNVIDEYGMILSDNFSATYLSQSGLIKSVDSSRVDHGSDPPVMVDHQSSDALVRNELGIDESKIGVSSDDDDGEFKLSESKCLSESDDLEDLWSDSRGDELVSGDSEIVNGEQEIVSNEEVGALRCGDERVSKRREIVWWKMPFVLMKYSVFKIGPVWSVSLASAVMGLVFLARRRLYNMNRKAQSFNLQVTVDDKKVSQVMKQAARLNEMFTEVRRVPVIRPSLTSSGAWPVLSLR